MCNHVFGCLMLCPASLLADRWALSCCVLLVLTQCCLRKSMLTSCLCLYHFILFIFVYFTPTVIIFCPPSPPALSIPLLLPLILPRILPVFLFVLLTRLPFCYRQQSWATGSCTQGTYSSCGYKMEGQCPLLLR